MPPILTLIIPVRGRREQYESLMESALSTKSSKLEIVVSDNSANEELKIFKDARVIHLRAPRALTMSENWSYAFEHATGRYVTFLGADEAVIGSELDTYIAELQDDAGVFHYAAPAFFRWPGLNSKYGLVSLKLRWKFPVVLGADSFDYIQRLNLDALAPNPYCRGSILRESLPRFALENPIPGPAPDFVLAHLAALLSIGSRLSVSRSVPFVVGTSKESTGLAWGNTEKAAWLQGELGHFEIQSLDLDFRSSYLMARQLLGYEDKIFAPQHPEERSSNGLPWLYARFPVSSKVNSATVAKLLAPIIRQSKRLRFASR